MAGPDLAAQPADLRVHVVAQPVDLAQNDVEAHRCGPSDHAIYTIFPSVTVDVAGAPSQGVTVRSGVSLACAKPMVNQLINSRDGSTRHADGQ